MAFRVPRRSSRAVAALAAATLALAGCGSADSGAGDSGTGDSGTGDSGAEGAPSVVASTNVWGSVVEAVAGDAVEVTTLIDDPSADPHSYQSTSADAAAITDADLVVFNGGGYDEFMAEILGSLEGKPTVNAFEAAAVEEIAHEGGANEHVWYELPAVKTVADQVAEELGRLLPGQAETFTANADSFHQEIDAIAEQVSAIAAANPDARVSMTEPIAVYLIEDAGLTNATPPEFLEAVEEEDDPPAAAMAAMRELMSGNQVAALVYNPQTETPVTQQVRSEAEGAGVPVVEMTETLPEDSGYVEWMTGQVEDLASALER